MTYILIFGAFAFFAARLFGGQRTITPRIVRDEPPGRQVTTSVRRAPPATVRLASAAPAPIEAETSAGSPGYLLGSSGAADTMAAVMDMMSGPGLLTPRDS